LLVTPIYLNTGHARSHLDDGHTDLLVKVVQLVLDLVKGLGGVQQGGATTCMQVL
jgi:hypothetical protein